MKSDTTAAICGFASQDRINVMSAGVCMIIDSGPSDHLVWSWRMLHQPPAAFYTFKTARITQCGRVLRNITWEYARNLCAKQDADRDGVPFSTPPIKMFQQFWRQNLALRSWQCLISLLDWFCIAHVPGTHTQLT